ncbi:MAG TPA: cell division protein ZapB [Thermoanaerobaculia bacterium]|nr:cell division protein ZapB [Thermoanaerobaculia bacterium]
MAIDWLDGLEEKVREATERLKELREENQALAQKVEALETRLAAVQEGHADDASQAWEAEREEIRRRVEKLTLGLEALVAE